MDRSSSSLFLCAVFLILFHFSEAQTLHVVGDGIGWTIPPNTSAYADWASGRTFAVGDVLQFNFITNQHDVVRVPQPSFTACSDDNEIGDTITTGPATVTLDSAGDHYYICTIGNHCQMGQRLAVSVGSSTPGPATNSPRMAPPQGSGSTSLAAAFLLSTLSAGVALIF